MAEGAATSRLKIQLVIVMSVTALLNLTSLWTDHVAIMFDLKKFIYIYLAIVYSIYVYPTLLLKCKLKVFQCRSSVLYKGKP